MPANGPVNVTKQCICAAIPILDIYAAYHIKKLRRYLLLVVLVIAIPQIAMEFALFGGMMDIFEPYMVVFDPKSDKFYQAVYVILWIPVGVAFAVIIIRRWSIEWNDHADVASLK